MNSSIDTIGSLCSGYGGLDRAVSAVFGAHTCWHAETDDAARTVLAKRFPDTPNLGDITAIDWRTVRRPDILCGGIPCQPFSVAGAKLGTADHRYLWPATRDAIGTLCPDWFVFENVAGLIAMNKGDLWRSILADLRQLGYAVAWGVFGACLPETAGCHHRHRLFAIARRMHTSWQLGEPGTRRWSGRACGVPRTRSQSMTMLASPQARDGGDGRSARGEGDGGYWARRRRESGRTNGVPLAAQLIVELARLELFPTPRGTDGTNGGPVGRGRRGDLAMPSAVQPEHFGRYSAAVARWSAIHGLPPAPTQVGPRGGLRLAPAFPEWMMGLVPGYVTDLVERNDALRLIGNGVFPLQAYHALTTLRAML